MRWYFVVISLVLNIIATKSMNNCTVEGDIRLKGLNTTCILAGRVELCYRLQWRAVCHYQWDRTDAMVVCRQLGVPHEGAISCTHSCFGRNDDLQGLYGFKCSGNETNLSNCTFEERYNKCGEYAGMICSAAVFNCSTFYMPSKEVTTATLTTTEANYTAPDRESTFSDMGNTSTAIEISLGLGGVSATLVLVLIGVVIAWVCMCYRLNLCRRLVISNETTHCSTKANVCYGMVDIKEASCGDNATANLNTETNVSYNVIVGSTSLPQKQREEKIYQEVEGTI